MTCGGTWKFTNLYKPMMAISSQVAGVEVTFMRILPLQFFEKLVNGQTLLGLLVTVAAEPR
jgi:hypothetical protein